MPVPLLQDTIQVSLEDSENLPPLGWIAEVDSGGRAISIQHGSRVEHGSRWIVEGVWDGPFGATFDRCAHLFGSGVKVGNESITFVPSCALVDRLVWADRNGALIVSNSLALLLAKIGARLISGESYDESLYAVGSGIDSYDDEIPTTAGPVHQLYYHNLEVRAGKRILQPKDHPREIASVRALRIVGAGDNRSPSTEHRRSLSPRSGTVAGHDLTRIRFDSGVHVGTQRRVAAMLYVPTFQLPCACDRESSCH